MASVTIQVDSPSGALILSVSPAEALAMNYAPQQWRLRYGALFALDARLRRYVLTNTEPLLSQIKLAWWREQMDKPVDGEPILAAVHGGWREDKNILRQLVDAYEGLLGATPVDEARAKELLSASAQAFASMAQRTGEGQHALTVQRQGELWSSAWLLGHRLVTNNWPRYLVGSENLPVPRLPRALRPIAVVGALGRRSLARGGAPIVGSAADVAVALRAGMVGR